ncbi:MAG: hypothetical protein HY231_14295 [Acidobacteria bacterium]|nr:hypothetical protein [Acidobacteriota bacterium]
MLQQSAQRAKFLMWLVVAALLIAGFLRFLQQPTFWLDEAFIAVSLKNPTLQTIFARLEYGQYFPRLYLLMLAAVREIFGYRIGVLRLLPFLFFVIGTWLWAKLLWKRAEGVFVVGLVSAALLLGATYWLDQAVQLKQYTFDVTLAVLPFLLGDEFYETAFAEGKNQKRLLLLALPCALSYTYPLSLGARFAGWYLQRGRRSGWRLRPSAFFRFAAAMALALVAIYVTDLRFNFQDRTAYLAYWNDCLLQAQLQQGVGKTARLLSKFLWRWHGRMPLVTAVLVPLQIIGVYGVIKRWKATDANAEEKRWGSRSVGSLVLLIGVMAASALLNYPICAGRVLLFTQVHIQLLTLEGALFLWALIKSQKARAIVFALLIGILLFHAGREYLRFVRAEPAENLKPVLPLIEAAVSDTIWVHPCSVAQVRALPDALPAPVVMLDGKIPASGTTVWILWTHLGDKHCQQALAEIKQKSRRWQVLHEGDGQGLALAEF